MSMDYGANTSTKSGLAMPVNVVGGSTANQVVTPAASGNVGVGATAFRSIAITNAGTSIKAAPGKVHGYSYSNPGSAACYVNLYNATAITVGTTIPVLQVLVPAGQTVDGQMPLGIQCGTGIMAAVTDASAPNSVTAAATLPVVNVQFI